MQKTSSILEESNYYAFGLKHEGYTYTYNYKYKYKYNGKELQDELGLNLYDYGWRNYDAAIARWVTPDPLLNDLDFTFDDNQVDEEDDDEVFNALITKAENGDGIYNPDNLSPYCYGYNNPVTFDDPDGRCPICVAFFIVALFAPEPAMAPTKNQKADAKAMGNMKALKADALTLFVPGGGTRSGASTVLRAVIKKEVKEQVKKTVEKVTNKAQERADKLSKKERPGKDFTKAGKDAVKELNKSKNGGKTVCENCKTETIPGTKDTKGKTPPGNRTEVDHVKRKVEGGSGTPNNGQILCKDCNGKKGLP
jgi:RHS repeat-associated protein